MDTNQIPDTVPELFRSQLPIPADQRERALAYPWVICARVDYQDAKGNNAFRDSRPALLEAGFRILPESDGSGGYYVALPPPGWSRSTEGAISAIFDERQRPRMVIYECVEPHLHVIPLKETEH